MVREARAPGEPRLRHAPGRGDGSGHARGGERGAVAVEFALLFPLLFLMLFGTLVVGWRVWEHQAGQSAAREAARLAALGIEDADVFGRTAVCLGEQEGLVAGGTTRVDVEYLEVGADGALAPAPSAAPGGYVRVRLTVRSRLGAVPLVSDSDGTFTSTGLHRIGQLGPVTAPQSLTTDGQVCG